MMMRRVAAALVQPWLEPLLTTQFFKSCPEHPESARGECNMYCLDCASATGAFCFYCRSGRHAGHRVIQIRRSSYHDVVRAAEIQKVLDISGVQTYVINSARVLFLNERPQPRGGGAAAGKAASPHACEICARSLLDPFRFCSLGCKLAGIKRNADTSFVLRDSPADEADAGGSGSGSGGGAAEAEAAMAPVIATSPPRRPTNSRRRKGIPHRAPFAP